METQDDTTDVTTMVRALKMEHGLPVDCSLKELFALVPAGEKRGPNSAPSAGGPQ